MRKKIGNIDWKIGFLTTIGLSILGIANRIIDRTSNEGWTYFQKTLVADGRYYLFQSERFRGQSIAQAIARVDEVFSGDNFSLENLNNVSLKMIETRPVYPFLTSLFGPGSEFTLMIIPITSWTLIHVLLFIKLSKLFNPLPVLLVISVVSCSFYFRYNLLATTSDALALLLIIPYIYVCILNQISFQNFILHLMIVCILLFTRPISPLLILTSLSMLFLSINFANKLFHLAVVSISTFHLVYLQVINDQITIQANANGSSSAFSADFIFKVLTNFPKVLVSEFAFLATNDTLFFILLIIGLLYSIYLGKLYKVTVLIVFFVCFLLGAVNGTIANGFRYQLPIIIVLLPSLIILVEKAITNRSKRKINGFS